MSNVEILHFLGRSPTGGVKIILFKRNAWTPYLRTTYLRTLTGLAVPSKNALGGKFLCYFLISFVYYINISLKKELNCQLAVCKREGEINNKKISTNFLCLILNFSLIQDWTRYINQGILAVFCPHLSLQCCKNWCSCLNSPS